MTKFAEILEKNVKIIKKSGKFDDIDLDLQKAIALPFFEKLCRDEVLQAEYRLDDIAFILLMFYKKTLENEKFTEDVLYEVINGRFFIHFNKYLEPPDAYEYVINAVFQAFEKKCKVFDILGKWQICAIKKINICPQLPMSKRNEYALLSTAGIIPSTQDPALNFPTTMN